MKRAVLTVIIVVVSLCFAGCGAGFSVYYEIPDYDGVIGGVSLLPEKGDEKPPEIEKPDPGKEPDEEPDKPPETDNAPSLDGYKLITPQGVGAPSSFGNNNFSPIEIDGKKFLIGKDGKTIPAPNDLTELFYDKYVFEENGCKGVKSVDGAILINASYTKIDIVKDTVLAIGDEAARIFDTSMADNEGNTMLVCEVPRGRFSSLSLYGEKLVVADGILCGLNLRPKTYDGFSVVGESDGIAIVKDESERFGLFDTKDAKLIVSPRYAVVSFFVNGYATASETIGGETIVIDREGKEIARFFGNAYGFYDGYMFADDGLGRLKLLDDKFNETGIAFDGALGKRVYNDFVIDTQKGRLFSVSKREYVGTAYEDIIPVVNGFICKNDGYAELIDFSLESVYDAEDIRVDGDVLNVMQDGKFYYFLANVRK